MVKPTGPVVKLSQRPPPTQQQLLRKYALWKIKDTHWKKNIAVSKILDAPENSPGPPFDTPRHWRAHSIHRMETRAKAHAPLKNAYAKVIDDIASGAITTNEQIDAALEAV
jgi:hypothetical protein